MAKGETIYLKREQVEICRKRDSTRIEKIKVTNIFFGNESNMKNKWYGFEQLKKATQLTIISDTKDTVLYLKVKSFRFNRKAASVTYTTF